MTLLRLSCCVAILLLGIVWGCESTSERIPIDKLPSTILDFVHTPSPHPLFRAADSLKYLGQYREVIDLLEELGAQQETMSNTEAVYLSNQYCYALLKTYHFQKAGKVLAAIELESTEADANRADWHLNQGLYSLALGKGQDAAYHLKQGESIYAQFYGTGHFKRLETLLALAQHYHNDIRLDSLKYCLQEADLIVEQDAAHFINRKQLYLLKGLAEQYDKGHEDGLLFIDLAIGEASQSPVDSIFLARCFAERSQMLRKIDEVEIAREALQTALDLWKNADQYPEGLLSIYEKLALQGIREKDSTSFFQVLRNIRSAYTEFPDAQTHPDCLLAYYSYHTGNYSRAIQLYRKLMNTYSVAEWDNRKFFDEAYFVLSEAYRKQLMLDSAIYFNQLSIKQLIDDRPEMLAAFAPGGSLEEIDPDYRHTLTIFLSKRPICQYESFRQHPDQHQDSLRQAIAAFLRLDSLFFTYSTIQGEDQLLEFADEHFNSTYDYAIEACFAAFQLWQDPVYLEYGHRFMERVKYAGMARGVFRRQFRERLPDTLGQKLLDLELEIDRLKLRRVQELDRLKKVVNKQIYTLEQQRTVLMDSIQMSYPNLPVLGADVPIPSLASLQDQAPYPILQYHHGVDQISCIIIKTDTLILRQWPYEKGLDTIAENYLKLLSINSNSHRKSAFVEFTELSSHLYQQLIAPLAATLTEVTDLLICPDANFPQLPYGSLLSEPSREQTTNYGGLAYLIRDWNINYTHSLQSLARSTVYDLPINPSILGYAFSDEHTSAGEVVRGDGIMLDPLPGAVAELKAIDSYLGPSTATIHLRYGTAANLEQLRLDVQMPLDIIHLGLHANSNTDNRWGNQIFFANKQGELAEVLFGTELEYLPLAGELVVLSACNTATGKELEGEGIYSLARSCLIAGAQEVIASLWTISDQHASEVMINFYQQLPENCSTATSLHAAKLRYLQKEGPAQNAFPGYWAGLVLFR